ncbi:Transcription factor IIIB 50 kDa subunit, partial [Frankliniella fusca]
MLKAGFSPQPPLFVRLHQATNRPPKKSVSETAEGGKCNDDLRVNIKTLSTRESHICDICSCSFKSKRLCDNHSKLCGPVANKFIGFKARLLSTWKESTINENARRDAPLNENLIVTGNSESQSFNEDRTSAENNSLFDQTMVSGIQGNTALLSGYQSNKQVPQEISKGSDQLKKNQMLCSPSQHSQPTSYSGQPASTPISLSNSSRKKKSHFLPPFCSKSMVSENQGNASSLSEYQSNNQMSQDIGHDSDSMRNQVLCSLSQQSQLTSNSGPPPSTSFSLLVSGNQRNASALSDDQSDTQISQELGSGSYPMRNQVMCSLFQQSQTTSCAGQAASTSISMSNASRNLPPSCSQSMSSGNQGNASLVSRRPLATIQIREARFRVGSSLSEDSQPLPDSRDPNFVQALNMATRVHRLMADAIASLKYNYNVKSILERAIGCHAVLETLNNGGIVYGSERNIVVNALVAHLFRHVSHPALFSTVMRECMAVQVVATWPALKMHLYSQEDRPWHHWYNADQNTGYLENATQVIQRTGKRPGSAGIRKPRNPSGTKQPRKLADVAPKENHSDSDPEEYLRDVSEARRLVGHATHKPLVLQLMARTFDIRRQKIQVQQIDTLKILSEFPHFMHFHGQVIEQEFNLMYELKQSSFTRIFVNDMVPKLLKIAEKNPKKFEGCFPTRYDVINAIVILAKLLPTPIRTFAHEAKMPIQANLIDFFNVIPSGSDPASYMTERQTESEYKIQPHILATGNLQGISKMWLVVDGKFLELPSHATPAMAIDLLLKSFVCFPPSFPVSLEKCSEILTSSRISNSVRKQKV